MTIVVLANNSNAKILTKQKHLVSSKVPLSVLIKLIIYYNYCATLTMLVHVHVGVLLAAILVIHHDLHRVNISLQSDM